MCESKLKVFEAFSGYGSQSIALRNLGIPYEVVAYAEIDKHAIASYEAIHQGNGSGKNLGDISKIDPKDIPDHDLFTYSFPCQDLSVAGNGRGFHEGSGTRSSLLWECKKVIETKKPQYLLLENVKNLVSKKFKPMFDEWLDWLEEQGYNNYYQVLNARDYGVPQNRERIFVVSILKEYDTKGYTFPSPIPLDLRLKDILEESVEEKYYLSEEVIAKLVVNRKGKAVKEVGFIKKSETGTKHQSNLVYDPEGVARTLTACDYKSPLQIELKSDPNAGPTVQRKFGIYDKAGVRKQAGSVYEKEGLSPALATMQGGWSQPLIEEFEQEIIEKGIIIDDTQGFDGTRIYTDYSPTLRAARSGLKTVELIDVELPCIGASRGRIPKGETEYQQQLELNKEGLTNTITTVTKDNLVIESGIAIKNATKQGYLIAEDGDGIDCSYLSSKTKRGRVQKGLAQTITTADHIGVVEHESTYRIRKLTPRECWRLMGVPDSDFDKASSVNSNTQLYKQAGNSIVVQVLEGIFTQLFLTK
jgi:DNA-methyltransferase (dcm)